MLSEWIYNRQACVQDFFFAAGWPQKSHPQPGGPATKDPLHRWSISSSPKRSCKLLTSAKDLWRQVRSLVPQNVPWRPWRLQMFHDASKWAHYAVKGPVHAAKTIAYPAVYVYPQTASEPWTIPNFVRGIAPSLPAPFLLGTLVCCDFASVIVLIPKSGRYQPSWYGSIIWYFTMQNKVLNVTQLNEQFWRVDNNVNSDATWTDKTPNMSPSPKFVAFVINLT